jgi:hypothetical protein
MCPQSLFFLPLFVIMPPAEIKRKRKPMIRTSKRMLYWAPRVWGIVYALFISLFALDVFQPGRPLAKVLLALAIHLIPTGIILVVLVFAWKWDWVGFVGFIALGLLYLWITRLHFPALVYFTISGSAFFIGLLFLANWHFGQRLHSSD